MAKIILTGRFMSEKLKKHWTSKDFANHFGVTEEEFISAFEKKLLLSTVYMKQRNNHQYIKY